MCHVQKKVTIKLIFLIFKIFLYGFSFLRILYRILFHSLKHVFKTEYVVRI